MNLTCVSEAATTGGGNRDARQGGLDQHFVAEVIAAELHLGAALSYPWKHYQRHGQSKSHSNTILSLTEVRTAAERELIYQRDLWEENTQSAIRYTGVALRDPKTL